MVTREDTFTDSLETAYVDMNNPDIIELLPLQRRFDEHYQMDDDTDEQNQSPQDNELRRQAQKRSRKKVSVKFRDPLSLATLHNYLIPTRRITTEHQDINAYVQRAGGLNEALLSVIAEKDAMRYSEAHVTAYVSAFLLEGASPSVTDNHGNTPLHLAAKRGFTQCAKELLKWGADANKENESNETPLEVSLSTGLALKDTERMAEFSTFAAMITLETRPAKVRDIFLTNPVRKAKINFHEMVKKPCMIDAVQAVLDSLVELISRAESDSQYDYYKVYYSLLDANQYGETPDKAKKRNCPSLLDVIILTNNKDIITHSSVRLLLRSKWKRFVRRSTWLRFIIFMATMLSMTMALILAVDIDDDPREYGVNLSDIFRGTMEAITLLFVLSFTLTELSNIIVWRLQYFKQHALFGFNYIHIATSLAVYSIIPLRIFNFDLQWIFASIAYVSHGLNIFKYMMAIKGIAIYVHILLRILRRDIMQFGLVFCAALYAFGGGFYFALRSEVREVFDAATNETTLVTDLDINPQETGEYDDVIFTGLRILVEGDSVIEYFGGTNELGPLGVLVYLIYLFFVVVVLLSLLVAQMSDTFASIQSDADRISIMIRAKIILTQERNGIFGINFRRRYFIREEVWKNPSNYLESLDVPGIEVVSRKVRKIDKECQLNNEHLQEIRDSLADYKKHSDKRMDELMNQIKQLSRDVAQTHEAIVAKARLKVSDD